MSLAQALHSASFHKWATVAWATGGAVITYYNPNAVWWIAIMSLYANIIGHWSSYQAARAEEHPMAPDTPCATCGKPLPAARVRRDGRDYHIACDPARRPGASSPIRETTPLSDKAVGNAELKERELRG